MPVLRVSGLSFSYGERPLFSELSFELRPGDFMCVLGPNGCGKSTLLKLLTGYIRAASGSVRLGGEEVSALRPGRLARRAAYVASETSVPYDFSVMETVLLGRTARAGLWRGYSEEDGRAAGLALRETGMAALAARSINTLSSGERQLAFIAQALAQETRLLLLDEPTSHLDLRYKEEVMGLLRRLAAKGLAVAAVLHEPGVARLGCTKTLTAGGGGKWNFGPAAELLKPERLAGVYGVPPDSPLLA